MVRRTRSYRKSGPRRRMFWARETGFASFNANNLAGVSNLLQRFEGEYGADLFGFTVTRIRGHMSHFMDSTLTEPVQTTEWITRGIMVESESDIATMDDQAVFQNTPYTSPHDDWMWARNQVGVTPPSQVGTGLEARQQTFAQQLAENRFEFDLKSQRRLDELGQSLYLFAGFGETPSDGSECFFEWDLHILCKRP